MYSLLTTNSTYNTSDRVEATMRELFLSFSLKHRYFSPSVHYVNMHGSFQFLGRQSIILDEKQPPKNFANSCALYWWLRRLWQIAYQRVCRAAAYHSYFNPLFLLKRIESTQTLPAQNFTFEVHRHRHIPDSIPTLKVSFRRPSKIGTSYCSLLTNIIHFHFFLEELSPCSVNMRQ